MPTIKECIESQQKIGYIWYLNKTTPQNSNMNKFLFNSYHL